MNIIEIWEKYSDNEYLEFDRILHKLSNRPDIHAFLLLEKLVPGNRDIVSGAGHDEIWLDISSDELEKNATEDQIIELIRCGVMISNSTNSLAMFV